MELLISEDVYEIPIPVLIRNDSFSFNYENFIRGYHEYMKVWSPSLGECLFGKKEPTNVVDKNAVAVIRLNSCCGKGEVIDHVPQNISKVVTLYLSVDHIATWNLKSLENVWTMVVAADLKLRQGFVFMGLKRPRSG